MTDTVVELEGANGEWFNLTTGDRGIFLGTGVTGLYDPPVKVVYEEPGNYSGARYLNHRILRRDIVFGVEILNDKGANSWVSRDSEWRKAWSFDRDCKLYITTPDSGTRYLKLRLGESFDIDTKYDPRDNVIHRVGMVCIAGDPFWYEEDVVHPVKTKTDTTFDPEEISAWDDLPKETLWIDVDPSDGRGGCNPTDQDIFPKWTLPAATVAGPGYPYEIGEVVPWEQCPFTQFAIPDYSFEKPAQANRRIRTPGLLYGMNAVVNSDPRVEQFSAEDDSPLWARTNGVRLRNPIPKYTESKRFEVTATGCVPGQVITLRLPRPWSRPWGLQ